MSRQVPRVTSLTFRSLGGPGRSAETPKSQTPPQAICRPRTSNPPPTKNGDSDFDHLVAGGTLCVDDVPAAVAQFALRDQDHRGRVSGVDLEVTTGSLLVLNADDGYICINTYVYMYSYLILTCVWTRIQTLDQTNIRFRSHLRIHRQGVDLVLLFGLGGSIKGPADLGDGSSADGGRDPDGGSCSAAQQVVGANVQRDRRLDWRTDREFRSGSNESQLGFVRLRSSR